MIGLAEQLTLIQLKLSMSTETTQHIGRWWLPENPENQISGSLSVHQREGIELKAIGSLITMQALVNTESDYLSRPVVVLGRTDEGKSISLLHVTPGEHKGDPFSSDFSTSVYNADIAIVGSRHFSSEEEVFFESVDAKFDLLNEWLGKSGIKRIRDDVDDRDCLVKMTIEYEFPDVIEFDVDSIEAQFRTNYNYNLNPTPFYYQLRHTSSFILAPHSPQSLDWYSEKFESLRRFLIMMTGFTLNIGELTEYVASESRDSDKRLNTASHRIYIRIGKGFKEAEEKHHTQLLLPLPRISIDLENLINTWFQKTDKLEEATALVASTLSIIMEHSESRFLRYEQACEVFYKRVYGDRRENKREIVTKLLDDVWHDCLENFIDDKNTFIDNVINTRNYWTHFTLKVKPKAVSGVDVFYLAERIRVLLTAHFLLQLEISTDEVYTAINQFEGFQYLKVQKNFQP